MAKTSLFKDIHRVLRKALFIQETDLNRRDFLRSAAIVSIAAAPASRLLVRDAMALDRARFSTQAPVLILGGGIAGLTAAYRLTQAGIRCELFEAAPRLGGRILTMNRFNQEGMFCELGGELIDSEHHDTLGLAAELGVAVDDFTPGDAAVLKGHYYFGGRHFYIDDLLPAFEPLARHVAADMKRIFKDPANPVINYKNHNPAAVRLDHMTMEEYLYSKTDVDRWVLDLFNVAYLGEYGADTDQQSALNLMLLMSPDTSNGFQIFGASDESRRIQGGNSRLIEALERAIAPHVPIRLGHELVKIEDRTSSFRMTFRSGSATRVRSGSKVICTIPFTLFRSIEGFGELELSPVKRRCIQKLAYGTNTKLMMGFDRKFWREERDGWKGTTGYTFTDLASQAFWDTSRLQNGARGVITNFIGGSAAQSSKSDWLTDALSDFEKIYPGSSSHFDGNHALFKWGTYRYSLGSYACPRPGQQTTIVGSAAEPECDDRLHFAGEHVSEVYQGYMNGAVQSANLAARSIIKSFQFSPVYSS